MRKVYAIIIALTFVFSTGAFANGFMGMSTVGQTESFSLYGQNPISLIGAQGSVIGSNSGTIDQDQSIMKIFDLKLTQSENTIVNQNASASGQCGSFDVFEEASAAGSQNQLLPNKGWKEIVAENQTLDIGLLQTADKAGGFGGADGTQCLVSNQDQSIVGKGTKMDASQFIGAVQLADVSGSAFSNASATNYLSVTADQTQTTNQ